MKTIVQFNYKITGAITRRICWKTMLDVLFSDDYYDRIPWCVVITDAIVTGIVYTIELLPVLYLLHRILLFLFW